MPPRTLSPAELRVRLLASGQPLDEADEGRPLAVWPTPGAAFTVALDLDPTLMPAARRAYFACLLKSEADPTPALRDDPGFTLPEPFRRLGAGGADASRFLDGPFRWLFPRLVGFGEVLVWPESGAAGATVLDLARDEDCAALWKVVIEVADGFENAYVADAACAEVARLHHHGRVTLSIPAEALRRAALVELEGRPDLFEDCSGYATGWDDEEA